MQRGSRLRRARRLDPAREFQRRTARPIETACSWRPAGALHLY